MQSGISGHAAAPIGCDNQPAIPSRRCRVCRRALQPSFPATFLRPALLENNRSERRYRAAASRRNASIPQCANAKRTGRYLDVGPVSPHSEEFGFCEIAERPAPGRRWRRDDQDHLSGANRKISRQRNMKFTARWDFRIEIDSPDHGLPFCAAPCQYNLVKQDLILSQAKKAFPLPLVWFLKRLHPIGHQRPYRATFATCANGAQNRGEPRLRCDCAVTSAVRGGVPEHRGIAGGLKTQPLRLNWTGLNCQLSGSIPVSATNSHRLTGNAL